MLPFVFENTRQFDAGAMGEAYLPVTLLPINSIRGSGSRVFRQFGAYSIPMTGAKAAPQAWNGIITGQFEVQGLIGDNTSQNNV